MHSDTSIRHKTDDRLNEFNSVVNESASDSHNSCCVFNDAITALVQKVISNHFDQLEVKLRQVLLKKTIDADKDLLTVKEVQTFMQLGRTTLYNYSRSNTRFPKPKRIGRRLLYSKKELLAFLNNNKPP